MKAYPARKHSVLVDNALEARARHIQIVVSQELAAEPDGPLVGVVDDGTGMDGRTLRTALRFGGSTRFNSRDGQGRFGMGLPNSSVSQAKRLEVYSWKAGKTPVYCYLDVDEIASGCRIEIPLVRRRSLPAWATAYARRSGTCVVWRGCDRLDCKRISTLVRRLHTALGRWFRYFLWDGVGLAVNGTPVEPVDPLFLRRRDVAVPGRLFGKPMTYELRLPGSRTRTSTVTVRFVELPLEELHDLPVDGKRRLGIVKGAGVSMVRAGREIDYGWYLMGAKRRENYDDWWRCEIRFESELDEYFGVTHSKQGVNPSAQLRACLSADLEAVAHKLNARVRNRYACVRARLAEGQTPATRIASRVDKDLPPVRSGRTPRRQKKVERANARHKGLSYRIRVAESDLPDFFTWHWDASGVVHVEVNGNHPFYTRLYEPLCEARSDAVSVSLECLLLSAVRAEIELSDSRHGAANRAAFRQAWSNALAVFLGL